MRVNGRKAAEPHERVELKVIVSRADGNVWPQVFIRERAAIAAALEGVNRPFARRSEIKLVVGGLPFQRDKDFEAGVLPKTGSEVGHGLAGEP